MNILIIEDDPTMRKVLGAIIEDYATTSFAANGAEGVKLVNDSFTNGSPFDLVCLDIMMPQMSGKEALKLIREVEQRHNASPMPVFVVSALTSNLVSKELHEDPNISFIEKPFKKEEIIQMVTDTLNKIEER